MTYYRSWDDTLMALTICHAYRLQLLGDPPLITLLLKCQHTLEQEAIDELLGKEAIQWIPMDHLTPCFCLDVFLVVI